MADDIITKPFRVTLRDHLVFGAGSYYRTMFLTPWAIFYAAMIFALPVSGYLSDHDIFAAALKLCVTAGLWLIAIPGISLFGIWRSYRSTRLVNGIHRGRLTDAGFEVEGEAFKSLLQWANFRQLRIGRSKIYLYISKSSAQIVPKAAFVDDKDMETFIKLATTRIAAAQHRVAATFDPPQTGPQPSSQWQSLPFRYTFFTHAVFYLQLSYAALARMFFIGLAIILSILLLLNRHGIMSGYWDDVIPQLIGFTAFYSVFLLIFPCLMLPFTWLSMRKSAAVRGSRTVSLTPERMISHGETFNAELNWSDLKKVRKGLGQILVYTRPNCAIVTPLSAFPDKATANAFYNQAVAYFKAAKAVTKTPAAKSQLDG